MNLAKHDAQTDMEMNMTSMIDVVFLLIIFFMIITDMTQQDLEELVLPIASTAVEDKPDPKERRPIINIPHTGDMIVKRKSYYAPETHDSKADPYEEVKEWLSTQAKLMKKDHLNSEAGTGPMIPDEPVLIRADQVTSFKHIQKVMEFCGLEGVQIWRVQIAVAVPEENE